MPAKRPVRLVLWLAFCALQTLQLIRFYSVSTIQYLKMPAYLSGHERMPFQERVLPILFLRPLLNWHWFMARVNPGGPFTAQRAPLYLLSLISITIAGIFVQKLYSAVTRSGALFFLVYPMFLFAIMWSYVIHMEANYSYPYDMPSVAFFAAGLYFIYTRRFLPLLAVIFFGTWNRETTLFLIGVFILDEATVRTAGASKSLRARFSLEQVRWTRVAALAFLWVAIKLILGHIFSQNDESENFIRLRYNLGEIGPRLWPALLNICGYLLPIVWFFRRRIVPIRFANYLYIMPFWFAIMFYTGVIVETRIYGELCSFVAVALVLIGEQYMGEVQAAKAPSQLEIVERAAA